MPWEDKGGGGPWGGGSSSSGGNGGIEIEREEEKIEAGSYPN